MADRSVSRAVLTPAVDGLPFVAKRADRRDAGHRLVALRTVIANQILDGNPSQTWQTARRLLDRGMGRHDVMDRLVDALTPFVDRALYDEERFDPDEYVEALARLPRPGRLPCSRRTSRSYGST